MRRALIGLCLVVAASMMPPAMAQLSINFSSPGVSIGVNVPVYPTFQRIPGYPVYYAPSIATNYFFYDGLYWVFDGDNWYESSWYNGPWYLVDPYDVPVFLLRVPVRYYHHRPAYFRGWAIDAAPRWGEHWGRSWESRRSGWDRWNRASAPAPAPLPTYQRQYAGSRYPQQLAQQAAIQSRSYNYQPRDSVARQHFEQQRTQVRSATQAQVQPQQPAPRFQAEQQAQQQRQERVQQQRQERAQQTQQAQQQRQERAQQTQQAQQQRQERAQQAHQQAQQQRQERQQAQQQAQQQRQERQQAQQQQRQERVQQAQVQRQEHAQPQPQRAERPQQPVQGRERPQREERGKERDKEG